MYTDTKSLNLINSFASSGLVLADSGKTDYKSLNASLCFLVVESEVVTVRNVMIGSFKLAGWSR